MVEISSLASTPLIAQVQPRERKPEDGQSKKDEAKAGPASMTAFPFGGAVMPDNSGNKPKGGSTVGNFFATGETKPVSSITTERKVEDKETADDVKSPGKRVDLSV